MRTRMCVVQVEAGEYDAMQAGLLRGPYLAQVELAWRRYRLRLATPSELAAAMLVYFKRFRKKLVVPQDLRKYAMALPRESAVWLAAAFAEERRSLTSEVCPTCMHACMDDYARFIQCCLRLSACTTPCPCGRLCTRFCRCI